MSRLKKRPNLRIYRTWAGNPRGTLEDRTRCIATVADGGRSVLSHQCNNKRGYGEQGLFCKIHAKRNEKYGWSLEKHYKED